MTIHPRQIAVLLVFVMAPVLLAAPAVAGDGDGAKDTKETKKASVEAEPTKPAANVYVQAVGSPAQPAGDSEVKVYTNEDLGKLFGTGTPGQTEDPAGTEPSAGASSSRPPSSQDEEYDPLKALEEQQQQQQDRRAAVADAEMAVIAAEENVAAVEKRIRAIRNPLLARPAAPEKDAEAWNELGAAERVERSEKELADARKALENARQHLADLRR